MHFCSGLELSYRAFCNMICCLNRTRPTELNLICTLAGTMMSFLESKQLYFYIKLAIKVHLKFVALNLSIILAYFFQCEVSMVLNNTQIFF
jgi:hypothetical protein